MAKSRWIAKAAWRTSSTQWYSGLSHESTCAHCGSWSDGTLEICPWCGGETREEPFVAGFAGAGSTAFRGRRRRAASRAATPTIPRSQQRDGKRFSVSPGAPRTTSRMPS